MRFILRGSHKVLDICLQCVLLHKKKSKQEHLNLLPDIIVISRAVLKSHMQIALDNIMKNTLSRKYNNHLYHAKLNCNRALGHYRQCCDNEKCLMEILDFPKNVLYHY